MPSSLVIASSETKVSEATAEIIVAAADSDAPAISGAALPAATRMAFNKPKVTDRVRVLVNNDVEYTYAGPGETLSDVARRTRSYSSELVKYNENLLLSSFFFLLSSFFFLLLLLPSFLVCLDVFSGLVFDLVTFVFFFFFLSSSSSSFFSCLLRCFFSGLVFDLITSFFFFLSSSSSFFSCLPRCFFRPCL